MWALVIVGIILSNPINKTTGSIELRFDSKEECIAAKESIDKNANLKQNKLMTSCAYRGFLR